MILGGFLGFPLSISHTWLSATIRDREGLGRENSSEFHTNWGFVPKTACVICDSVKYFMLSII